MTWLFQPTHRPWTVLIGMASILMLAFLVFALGIGWPPSPESCFPPALRQLLKDGQQLNATQLQLFKTTNECFCEAFDPNTSLTWSTGVRQEVNTWFNLYALGTAAVVAWALSGDRRRGGGDNVISSNSWIADLYVFCVLFLGLGSMWFHASMSAVVAWFDGFSMYVYTCFLVYYTVDRWLAKQGASDSKRGLVFWIGYCATVLVFIILHIVGVPSVILIALLVAGYLLFEFFFAGWISGTRARVFWWIGVGAMGAAVLFWVLSQTGAPLCKPDSFFQPHGLLWHPLAGLMAVMLHFYWREDRRETDKLVWTHTTG
jgi:hypothetical protein